MISATSGPQGTASKPAQRRLSPTDVDDLIAAHRAGTTISQLAADRTIHRTTVAAHLDRHEAPRHHDRTAGDDDILKKAAEMDAAGRSLADVANRFGVDGQTVANRFRRAGVPVRARRGWSSRAHSEEDRKRALPSASWLWAAAG